MSNLQPNCCLKFDFQKVDQHAGGNRLIYDTKRRKDNQLQSLKLPDHNLTSFCDFVVVITKEWITKRVILKANQILTATFAPTGGLH